MDLKKKINELMCSKYDHEWVKSPEQKNDRADLYICRRCGKQMQVIKPERY